jgi:hypothetical protein
MKALTDKIVESLEHKRDSFIGSLKNKETVANSEGFRNGLDWAIVAIESMEDQAEFEEVARVMMKHLGRVDIYHPHHTVIISNSTAELVEGQKALGKVMDYLPD